MIKQTNRNKKQQILLRSAGVFSLKSIHESMSELIPSINRALSLQSDDDDDVIDESDDWIDFPFDDEVENIRKMSTSFKPIHGDYPFLFRGSLEEACDTAFHIGGTKGYPAVLAYIYHQESPFIKEVYNILCVSKEITYYLNTNYIVWPCDITSESNRLTLVNKWKKMFSTEFFDQFSLKQYPLLIGIMPLYGQQTDAGFTIEYQFRTLVIGNWLKRHSEAINRKIFFNHIKNFKAQCDRNVNNLSFNFVEKTRLSWEIVLEIAQYLSLNDSIATFSMEIIPLLNQYKTKLQLSKIDYLLERVSSKLSLNQIVSLRLKAYQEWSTRESSLFSRLTQVKSLTLYDPINFQSINKYRKYLPNLIRLSLIYTTQIDWLKFIDLLRQSYVGLKRVEIRAADLSVKYKEISEADESVQKYSIEYFLFDTTHGFTERALSGMEQSTDRYFPIWKFIQNMPNIRQVRLIAQKCDLSAYCDDDPWIRVMRHCPKLKKVTLQGIGYSPEEENDFAQSASTIQTVLRKRRPEMVFQMKF